MVSPLLPAKTVRLPLLANSGEEGDRLEVADHWRKKKVMGEDHPRGERSLAGALHVQQSVLQG